MGQPIIVGCDLHDRTLVLKSARGLEPPRLTTVKNTAAERAALIARLRAAAGDDGVIFAYEASGQGFGLHDELSSAGIACHVLAPTKIVRSTKGKRLKDDAKDAEDVFELLRAHVLAGNRLPTIWIPDRETRDDRELVRTRLDLTEKSTAVKRQIKSLLKRHARARPAELGVGWTVGYRAWLKASVACPDLGSGLRGALASLLRQLEEFEAETKRLDQALTELVVRPRYARPVAELVKLSGVGVLTALTFLTEIGDLQRFPNRRAFGSYLGLTPAAHESGDSADRKGHITRQGPSRVRKLLCQAAWARVSKTGEPRQAYERIALRNPKRKKIALVAGMRRLAVLMWHRGRAAQTQLAAAS